MRNGSLGSDIVFEKKVIFHEFDFETSSLEFEVFEIKHLKAHNSVRQGCFYFHYYLFNAFVDIHQVRRLVFDNYQYCLLSFKAEFLINTPQVTDCISELGKEHRRAVNNINQIQTK